MGSAHDPFFYNEEAGEKGMPPFSELPAILASSAKATPICVIYPEEEPESGSFGNWPVIALDLEIDLCQRYDSKGQDGRRPI